MEKTILQLFPQEYRPLWQQVSKEQEKIQEIRLRVGKPVMIHSCGKEYFLSEQGERMLVKERERAVGSGLLTDLNVSFENSKIPVKHIVTDRELEHVIQHICHYSPYAYEEELRRGFLTVAGGHRVGVTGQVVLEADGSVRTIKNISGLNIRVAHQIKGAADNVISHLYRNQKLRSTLIISPPGCGKTTLLRDLVRQISEGNEFATGLTVGVVDERSELAGSYLGIPQNDLGMRTDVLDGCPKREGMLMLLRSMSPRVVAVDEVGEQGEWDVLRQASTSGCKLLATVHGENIEDVERRFGVPRECLEQIFEIFLILGKRAGKCEVMSIVERRH